MCSILAIATHGRLSPDITRLAQGILDEASYRGPDDQSLDRIDERALLGSNRLRIIDPEPSSKMPMKSVMAEAWIVYNGEIYNYRELRTFLKRQGFRFATSSDTEVVVNAYLHWGDEFVAKLNGIFSFVIYDKPKQRLVVARDRFGVKPLYYTQVGDHYIFSSRFQSLCKHELHPSLSVGKAALSTYQYFRFVPGGRTIFNQIKKLEQAQLITVELANNEMRFVKYWTPEVKLQPFSQELFNEKLDSAIRHTRVSDVSPSILLSGGLDSSAVTALFREHVLLGEIQAYSCAFSDPEEPEHSLNTLGITNANIDERHYASQVAKRLNCYHESFLIDVHIGIDDFYGFMDALDEPIASPNALGLYLFARKLAQRTRVALSGTGADELLGGYEELYFGRSVEGLYSLPSAQIAERFSDFDQTGEDVLSLLSVEYRDTTLIESLVTDSLCSFSFADYPKELLNQLSLFELSFGLPGWELDQADRLFMSQSIELRPAFLENSFVDYCLTIPSLDKRSKAPLVKSMGGLLPDEIIARRKFPGLGTPRTVFKSEWFQGALQALSDEPLPCWDKQALSSQLSKVSTSQKFDLVYRVAYLQAWFSRFREGYEGVIEFS